MNMDELEKKLRALEPRRPSAGFAGRVLAQRPEEELLFKPIPPWWRRRVAIPLPALAAVLLLFILIPVVQWRLARPRPSAVAEQTAPAPAPATSPSHQPHGPSPKVTVALATEDRQPELMVTLSGNCAFQFDR